MKRYEFIDHTADLGIKLREKSLTRLFASAGYALFDIILEISQVQPKKSLDIHVSGEEIESILVDWLRELLFKFNMDRWVLKEFDIGKIDESGLQAVVKGETFDPSRHSLKTEIKAVTYHGLEVNRKNDGWEAQIIFDI